MTDLESSSEYWKELWERSQDDIAELKARLQEMTAERDSYKERYDKSHGDYIHELN